MKNYILILIFGMMSLTSFSQDEQSSFKLISNANFSLLASQLSGEVELILPQRSDVFPKAKVIAILKEAIQKIEPVAWKEKHIGGTRGGQSTYSVGHIKTAKGESFRLYIIKERSGNGLKIVSIELERQ